MPFHRSLLIRLGALSHASTPPRWLAPEVLEGEQATLASDVYSFGIILWECLTFEVPFAQDNHCEHGALQLPCHARGREGGTEGRGRAAIRVGIRPEEA